MQILKNETLYHYKYLIIIFYPERNIGRPLSLRQQVLHKHLESLATCSLCTGQILFLIIRKLSITSVWKGLSRISPSPALLHMFTTRHALYDTRGQWSCSYTASPSPHTWVWRAPLQVTITIKMIVFDIRLVFSDLHQQFKVEIQCKTGNGWPTCLVCLL